MGEDAPECRIAYPEAWDLQRRTSKGPVSISKLQCDELGQFMARSLRETSCRDPARARLQDVVNLDYRLAPGLRVRGAQVTEAGRRKALAAVKLGRPSQVWSSASSDTAEGEVPVNKTVAGFANIISGSAG
jgi:hypothetical protein